MPDSLTPEPRYGNSVNSADVALQASVAALQATDVTLQAADTALQATDAALSARLTTVEGLVTALQAADAALLPVGAVVSWTTATAPTGWKLCDGSAVNRTTYAALFAAIGTTFGVGDGSTTFNLPDLRGRVVVGKDNMGGSSANRMITNIAGGTLGAVGGAESHTLTTAQLAAHAHGISAIYNGPGGAIQQGGTTGPTASVGTDNAGGGTAHNNTQPGLILNIIIYAGA